MRPPFPQVAPLNPNPAAGMSQIVWTGPPPTGYFPQEARLARVAEANPLAVRRHEDAAKPLDAANGDGVELIEGTDDNRLAPNRLAPPSNPGYAIRRPSLETAIRCTESDRSCTFGGRSIVNRMG